MLFVQRGLLWGQGGIGLHISARLSMPSMQTSNSRKYLSGHNCSDWELQANISRKLMTRNLFTQVNKCALRWQSSWEKSFVSPLSYRNEIRLASSNMADGPKYVTPQNSKEKSCMLVWDKCLNQNTQTNNSPSRNKYDTFTAIFSRFLTPQTPAWAESRLLKAAHSYTWELPLEEVSNFGTAAPSWSKGIFLKSCHIWTGRLKELVILC